MTGCSGREGNSIRVLGGQAQKELDGGCIRELLRIVCGRAFRVGCAVAGAIESCIINVLFQAQRKRTVLDEGAQQIFVVLQGARGVACQIRELINFVNGAIG